MFLSIITVNLNNRSGLEKTIYSVINQTSPDYEWIVIDGGSTDGSKELLEKNNSNISYWVSEPDKGIYNAMNKGIERSSGEYLLFLNSGDSLHSDNVISEFEDSNPTCEVVCCREMIGNDIAPVVPPEDINYQWFLIKLNTIPHQATFIKRAAFMKYGVYDEKYKIASDFKWFSNALIKFDATYETRDIVVSDFEGGGVSDNVKYNDLKYSEIEHIRQEILPRCYSAFKDISRAKDEFEYLKAGKLGIVVNACINVKRIWKKCRH